jgi:hypothetical protein
MLQYRRPYLSPQQQAIMAERFAAARPLFLLASGVRPHHHPHRDALRLSLANWLTEHMAYGHEYPHILHTALRRRFTAALAESALTPPHHNDYARLIDNALHSLPPFCEVRYTTHTRTPHNRAPKAYLFHIDLAPEGQPHLPGLEPRLYTTGSTSPQRPHSR